MSEFLFQYFPVHPTTWVYLSSLLMIGLFFKFNRFWSVRNLDLVLLATLAPGLLLVHFGAQRTKQELAAIATGQSVETEPGARDTIDGSADGNSEGGPAGAEQAAGLPAEDRLELPGRSADGEPLAEGIASADALPANPSRGEPAPGPEGSISASAKAGLSGKSLQLMGFVWLLGTCGLFLIRLLLDPAMVRRPLLEPNLSPGGLTFIGCSLFVFLMANVVNSQVTEDDIAGPRSAEMLISGVADEGGTTALRRHGPGNALLHFVPSLATVPLNWRDDVASDTPVRYVRIAKTMAILSHLAVVVGIVAIGYRHFENIRMGIGAATLYLMLPYTSQMTGRVDHVLPAALLVWAVLCYRRPMTAGMFIGLAIGVLYYPLFLLPLWISFYWQRGLMRFLVGVLATLSVSLLSLLLVSTDIADFLSKTQTLFGVWLPVMDQLRLKGVWGLGWDPVFRIPILAAFVAVSCAMAIWPVQKNLGTLLSCSAAIMVATQFWHGYGGGLYQAWFLPLLLLTVFRPNLEDRVALSVLGEGWFYRRRHRVGLNGAGRAA